MHEVLDFLCVSAVEGRDEMIRAVHHETDWGVRGTQYRLQERG